MEFKMLHLWEKFPKKCKTDNYFIFEFETEIVCLAINNLLFLVPERVWVINELTNDELSKLDVTLDYDEEKERWWEQEQLKTLNLSSNSLTELDSRVKFLSELNTLDVSH